MGAILSGLESADAIVLASPMNFGSVTAVMKRFIERLIPFAYWPWTMGAPKVRNRVKDRKALLVASSAAPSILARMSSGMIKLLNTAAGLLGARRIGVLFIGLASMDREQRIGKRTKNRARHLGIRLAR